MSMAGFLGQSIYLIGLNANAVLEATAEVIIGKLLLQHAILAQSKLAAASADDKAYYQGKIESARFFLRNTMPLMAARKRMIDESTLTLMELPEEAF